MTTISHTPRVLLACACALALGACQTVKMPKINLDKSSEFSEEAKSIAKDYPRVSDAPLAPDDIRSSAQWDKDAVALQNLRAKKSQFTLESGPDAAESAGEFEALKAKVQAYKQDDPPSGPIQGFPDHEPRR